MFFNEDHLKITKTRTADGVTPVQGPDERPLKKIIFVPYSKLTMKLFEDQNSRLPTALKMKIEVVKAYSPQPVNMIPDTKEADDLKKQLEDLKKQNDLLASENKDLQDFKVLKELEAEDQAGKNLIQQTASNEKK